MPTLYVALNILRPNLWVINQAAKEEGDALAEASGCVVVKGEIKHDPREWSSCRGLDRINGCHNDQGEGDP